MNDYRELTLLSSPLRTTGSVLMTPYLLLVFLFKHRKNAQPSIQKMKTHKQTH